MKIAITGAAGMLGSMLTPFLEGQGHTVVRFSRGGGANIIRWNPARQEIDLAALRDVEAVIHLAGANLAGGRWTRARKRELVSSRVEVTRWFVEVLGRLASRPRLFLGASAVGYYGDTGDSWVDEAAAAGRGFLAELCAAWEAEAARAAGWGARVVALRSGVVLSPAGGALAKLLPVFRAGLGGPIAGGRTWMSWIAPEDFLGAVNHVLAADSLRGPVNLVAPAPVTNAEFTQALSRVLHRPALVPVPAAALRLAIGEMADEALLANSRVRPARLVGSGYVYRWPELEPALRHELGR